MCCAQLSLIFCEPRHYSPPSSSVHEENPGGSWHFVLQGFLPNPGIEPESPTLQADSLPSEPPGKPRGIEIGLKFRESEPEQWRKGEWVAGKLPGGDLMVGGYLLTRLTGFLLKASQGFRHQGCWMRNLIRDQKLSVNKGGVETGIFFC